MQVGGGNEAKATTGSDSLTVWIAFALILEIVADERLRHPAQEAERIDMGSDPVGQRLPEPGLGEGVVRSPNDGDEDLGGADPR